MKRKLLVADLLCGAGGSSTGCQRALAALGMEMELVCVNHWPVAIDTHQRNHPEARHYVQDIATVRPHILVPEGYLDLLMASPTCTHHSVARGGKPTSDQQRSDPWHIITWLTELRVKRIIIENVWEFIGWGPVDLRTGKPLKSRKGEYFHAWIETIKRLGFDPEWRKLNAANYGDATTRQRFILKARNDRKLVRWAPLTHAKRGEADLFCDMKPWRPARDIIDWSIKGRSIFNRPKALAPKTLMRIHAGALKHDWPAPFIVVLRNHMAAQGIDVPLPTIAANGQHIALAEPVIMNGRKGNHALPVSEAPIPTLDTKGGVWLAEPLVLSQHNSGAARQAERRPRSARVVRGRCWSPSRMALTPATKTPIADAPTTSRTRSARSMETAARMRLWNRSCCHRRREARRARWASRCRRRPRAARAARMRSSRPTMDQDRARHALR
jgi:DNA (cytosine-5)-methyltransferase 1